MLPSRCIPTYLQMWRLNANTKAKVPIPSATSTLSIYTTNSAYKNNLSHTIYSSFKSSRYYRSTQDSQQASLPANFTGMTIPGIPSYSARAHN